MHPRLLRMCLCVSLVFGVHGVARAAGPMLVNGAGAPLAWTGVLLPQIPFNPDRGTLGSLSNAEAIDAVTANFNVWHNVPTAMLTFYKAAALPADVTAANWWKYVGICDHLSEIVFDTDGQITDNLFGAGASNDILGFAAPACGTQVPPVITEGMAVLNGKWIDGISSASNPEMPLADFNGVFVHEFGHFINLDHSQINFTEAFDGDPGNNDAVATMFPYAVKGAAAATLHLDDIVSVSMLYPAESLAQGSARFAGTVFNADGATPFQGAYVIARATNNPRMHAVGVASGARYFPANGGGPPPSWLKGFYEIPGLPPGEYTLEIEEVNSMFTGNSSVGPLDPPARLPGVPEFYNGASEAATNPPDDPADFVPVTALAGGAEEGLDFIINGFPPPPNDDCSTAREIKNVPYVDVVDTLSATIESTDPSQSCGAAGASRNSNSAWYLLTATEQTVLTLDTFGSDYDTVLSAYMGSCGALIQIACNDDANGLLASKITVPVAPKSPVLIEVTSLGDQGGGTLTLNARPALQCTATPRTNCSTPDKSSLQLVDNPPTADDKTVWGWGSGVGSLASIFGDPTAGTDFALCVYDMVIGTPQLKLSAIAPTGGTCKGRSCWQPKGTSGFVYRDPGTALGGLASIKLRTSLSGSTRLKLKGQGVNLGMPDLPLTKDDSVIAQMVNSSGGCWGAEYRQASCKPSRAGVLCSYSP